MVCGYTKYAADRVSCKQSDAYMFIYIWSSWTCIHSKGRILYCNALHRMGSWLFIHISYSCTCHIKMVNRAVGSVHCVNYVNMLPHIQGCKAVVRLCLFTGLQHAAFNIGIILVAAIVHHCFTTSLQTNEYNHCNMMWKKEAMSSFFQHPRMK